MTSYSDRLKDPRWQRRRLEILQRSNFSCESCEATDKTLHVHHKLYRKGAMPWEYEDHELQVLCEDCHADETNVRERLKQALAELDVSDLEEVLGYAQGCRATMEVFNDLPEEGAYPDRTWKLESYSQARGFLVRLLSRIPFDGVERFRAMEPIDHGVVFGVSAHGLPADQGKEQE